jgi:hypothetical protein
VKYIYTLSLSLSIYIYIVYIYISIIYALLVLRDCNQAQGRERIIWKVKEKVWEGVDRIDLAQDMN